MKSLHLRAFSPTMAAFSALEPANLNRFKQNFAHRYRRPYGPSMHNFSILAQPEVVRATVEHREILFNSNFGYIFCEIRIKLLQKTQNLVARQPCNQPYPSNIQLRIYSCI